MVHYYNRTSEKLIFQIINIPNYITLLWSIKFNPFQIYYIYPNLKTRDSSWLRERAILTPTNESEKDVNNFLLEQQTAEEMIYNSIDDVIELKDTVHYPVEFLHTLDPPRIPPHSLRLKIGVPVSVTSIH